MTLKRIKEIIDFIMRRVVSTIMTEDDYCFDCKEWIAPGDSDHIEHDTLKNRSRPESPPDLGVKVSDGVGVKMERG